MQGFSKFVQQNEKKKQYKNHKIKNPNEQRWKKKYYYYAIVLV